MRDEDNREEMDDGAGTGGEGEDGRKEATVGGEHGGDEAARAALRLAGEYLEQAMDLHEKTRAMLEKAGKAGEGREREVLDLIKGSRANN
jgi:hypothetical protein